MSRQLDLFILKKKNTKCINLNNANVIVIMKMQEKIKIFSPEASVLRYIAPKAKNVFKIRCCYVINLVVNRNKILYVK